MVYAIDSDVVIAIEKAGALQPVSSLGRRPIVITEFVWDEVARPANRGTEAMLVALAGQCRELTPGSPEAGAMVTMQVPFAEKGRGEASIIAYSLHHAEVVPVLIDRLALYRAVEELGGRPVLSLHGFLRVLESWGLPSAVAERVSATYCRSHVPITQPTWWRERASM